MEDLANYFLKDFIESAKTLRVLPDKKPSYAYNMDIVISLPAPQPTIPEITLLNVIGTPNE